MTKAAKAKTKSRTAERWPPGAPRKISEDAWFYEEQHGITVSKNGTNQ